MGLACSLGVVLFVAGCSDDDGGGPVAPDPSTVPEVVVTRPVGNPPVEGVVELVPRVMEPGASPWRFEVDLDGDGEADASGEVRGLMSVPFSFEAPGLHPVRVVLTRGGERAEVERSVNVLDPDRIEVLGTVQLEGAPLIEGIAVDRSGTHVYVARSIETTLVRLDPATLVAQNTISPPGPTNTLEGLAVAPDEELLYVVSKGPSPDLWLVDLDRSETEAFFPGLSSGQFYVEALPGRRVYTSGEGGLALADADRGEVVSELGLRLGIRAWHFAVSPSGDRIATILLGFGDPGSGLAVTDANLNEIRRTEPIGRFFEDVAWSPVGDRIYVRYEDRLRGERCGILVFDAAMLEVTRDVPLGADAGCSAREFSRGVANPVASTPDGRFLVLPAPEGAFVFDTAEDRPVARTPASAGGGTFNFCCDVAAGPDEDVFYVAGTDGWVTKFRFLRGD